MNATRGETGWLRSNLWTPAACLVAVVATTALAGTSVSGSFSGGGFMASSNYSLSCSIGVVGGLTTTGQVSLVSGGPMPAMAKSLVVSVAPPLIPEGTTGQLSGIATLDDGTVSVLGGPNVGWGAATYPFGAISTDGVVTATNVYATTNGVITGFYLGASASLWVTVLDSSPDDFGLYAGDGVPDAWQVRYFGVNNPLGTGTATNATGQDNYYAYAADLNPTNPASTFKATAVSGSSTNRRVYFAIASTGRYYCLQYSTNLVDGAWMNLPGQSPTQGVAGQMSLVDTNSMAVRFYRVQVQTQ